MTAADHRPHPRPVTRRPGPSLVLLGLDVDAARELDVMVTIGGEDFPAVCPPLEAWRQHLAPIVGAEGTLYLDGTVRDAKVVVFASRFLAEAVGPGGVHAIHLQFQAGKWRRNDVLDAVGLLLSMWWEFAAIAMDT